MSARESQKCFFLIACYIIEVTEQKPTKKNDEDVEGKDQDDSVAVTKIAEEDTVENSSVCLEMEDDATSASPLQEMQSKLDGSEVSKGNTYARYQIVLICFNPTYLCHNIILIHFKKIRYFGVL